MKVCCVLSYNKNFSIVFISASLHYKIGRAQNVNGVCFKHSPNTELNTNHTNVAFPVSCVSEISDLCSLCFILTQTLLVFVYEISHPVKEFSQFVFMVPSCGTGEVVFNSCHAFRKFLLGVCVSVAVCRGFLFK